MWRKIINLWSTYVRIRILKVWSLILRHPFATGHIYMCVCVCIYIYIYIYIQVRQANFLFWIWNAIWKRKFYIYVFWNRLNNFAVVSPIVCPNPPPGGRLSGHEYRWAFHSSPEKILGPLCIYMCFTLLVEMEICSILNAILEECRFEYFEKRLYYERREIWMHDLLLDNNHHLLTASVV
jgi:hypothetical protein